MPRFRDAKRPDKGTIVKVQFPLVGNGPALVYAKGRDRPCDQPITAILRAKMKGRSKAFFYGHYSSVVGWAINDEAPWQEW